MLNDAKEALDGLGWVEGFCDISVIIHQVVLRYTSISIEEEYHHLSG
jgi:hypothetical protein